MNVRFTLNLSIVILFVLFVAVYVVVLSQGISGAPSPSQDFYNWLLLVLLGAGAVTSALGGYVNYKLKSDLWSTVHVLCGLVFWGILYNVFIEWINP